MLCIIYLRSHESTSDALVLCIVVSYRGLTIGARTATRKACIPWPAFLKEIVSILENRTQKPRHQCTKKRLISGSASGCSKSMEAGGSTTVELDDQPMVSPLRDSIVVDGCCKIFSQMLSSTAPMVLYEPVSRRRTAPSTHRRRWWLPASSTGASGSWIAQGLPPGKRPPTRGTQTRAGACTSWLGAHASSG